MNLQAHVSGIVSDYVQGTISLKLAKWGTPPAKTFLCRDSEIGKNALIPAQRSIYLSNDRFCTACLICSRVDPTGIDNLASYIMISHPLGVGYKRCLYDSLDRRRA